MCGEVTQNDGGGARGAGAGQLYTHAHTLRRTFKTLPRPEKTTKKRSQTNTLSASNKHWTGEPCRGGRARVGAGAGAGAGSPIGIYSSIAIKTKHKQTKKRGVFS